MTISFLLAWMLVWPACAEKIPPQAAGSFYPAGVEELAGAVDSFLTQASSAPVSGDILAAMVPHAGYPYSGKTAAEVFRRLRGRNITTVFVLATGHRLGIKGAATLLGGSLSTPLGEVPVDEQETRALLKAQLIEDMPAAFQEEHSVEVELPFLQRALAPGFKIVPLLMNTQDPEVCRKIGSVLAKRLKPGTFLLVSSDLSHYPDKVTARSVDLTSLAALVRATVDPLYFWRANRSLMERGGQALACTECGEAAVLAALYAMKTLGASARLLAYTNSGELPNGDPSRTVGYAALLWTRGGGAKPRPRLDSSQRSELLKLARQALSFKLTHGIDPKPGLWLDPEFNLPAAVFVTLRGKGAGKSGSLRGCVGSLEPNLPLGEAVQFYAIMSALEDRRFKPVVPAELPGLRLEISRLSPFRGVSSAAAVRKGQGVTLSQGSKAGLFLPQVWEDLPDKTIFLQELCEQKAGLPRDCWKDSRTKFKVFDAEAFQE